MSFSHPSLELAQSLKITIKHLIPPHHPNQDTSSISSLLSRQPSTDILIFMLLPYIVLRGVYHSTWLHHQVSLEKLVKFANFKKPFMVLNKHRVLDFNFFYNNCFSWYFC